MDWIQNRHWITKIGIAGLILFGIYTLVKWLGLTGLGLMQLLSFSAIVFVLVGVACQLLKTSAIDGTFGFINSFYAGVREAWVQTIEEAKEELKRQKQAS